MGRGIGDGRKGKGRTTIAQWGKQGGNDRRQEGGCRVSDRRKQTRPLRVAGNLREVRNGNARSVSPDH